MQNYFDREIKYLEKEITNLKTSGQKSSALVKTIAKTTTVSVQLQWEDISYPNGSARARAAYEVVTSKDAIIMSTLSWYHENIFSNYIKTSREITLTRGVLSNGNYGAYLYFYGTEGGDNSDAARTKRGETVTVSVDLTVVCTQDFTLRRIL